MVKIPGQEVVAGDRKRLTEEGGAWSALVVEVEKMRWVEEEEEGKSQPAEEEGGSQGGPLRSPRRVVEVVGEAEGPTRREVQGNDEMMTGGASVSSSWQREEEEVEEEKVQGLVQVEVEEERLVLRVEGEGVGYLQCPVKLDVLQAEERAHWPGPEIWL